MTDTMAISITPLSDALGAEIGGVDLGRELDAARSRDNRLKHKNS